MSELIDDEIKFGLIWMSFLSGEIDRAQLEKERLLAPAFNDYVLAQLSRFFDA